METDTGGFTGYRVRYVDGSRIREFVTRDPMSAAAEYAEWLASLDGSIAMEFASSLSLFEEEGEES